jgi:hypothetical protein
MKYYKPGTEVRILKTYSDPDRERVKHGIVVTVNSQSDMTARIGHNEPETIAPGSGRNFIIGGLPG